MRILLSLCLMALLSVMAGCGQPAAEATVDPPTTAPPTATIAPTDTPVPTATATTTATPEPLTAGAIFEQLSPSVAYVRTEGASGSGALLEGGYVLTNAHVVWPYDAADVTFPDGETISDVPVAANDPLRDLALLGPIETDRTPITFVDGEDAAIGGDVLLIGYPGESDHAPQPTLSQGLISRVREWEEVGLTFFQTSSAVAGGQSGGIAVLPDGRPIGLSGLRFTEANYGLIASAADLAAPLAQMRAAAETGAGDGQPPRSIRHESWAFESIHDQRVYRVDAPDSDVTVTIEGPTDASLAAMYPNGMEAVFADDGLYGEEKIVFTTPAEDVPLFILADYVQEGDGEIRFSLDSDTDLTLVEDADDGQTLHLGQVYTGTVDFPFDADTFTLSLSKGQVVNLRADSIGFDPSLVVDPGLGVDLLTIDYDSGRGLLDTSAELTYEAPRPGTYTIAVYDFYGNAAGAGYTLAVGEPYEGAPTPSAPDPTPTPISAAAGDMRLYDNPELPYTLEMPFDYVDRWQTLMCREWTELEALACLSDPDPGGQELIALMFVEDLQAAGGGDLTLEELTAIIYEGIRATGNFSNMRQTPVETAGGRPAYVVSATFVPTPELMLTRLITLEDGKGYYVTFVHTAEEQAIVDHMIASFRKR